MTQRESIINMLSEGDWICGSEFLKAFIPEFRSRINELRKSGHNIIARRCLKHQHNGLLQEWRLIETTPRKDILKDCCYWFSKYGDNHSEGCKTLEIKQRTLL